MRKPPRSVNKNAIKNCDIVCFSCPFYKNNKCMKRPNINNLIKNQDSKVIKKLNIKKKDMAAREIFSLSISMIKNKELKEICRGCNYLNSCLKYGLNKSFIKSIK